MRSTGTLFLLLSLTGCATVPMASSTLDLEAKRFATPEGRAQLYVVRPSAATGASLVVPVEVDGRRLGSLGPGTYLLASLEPGEHVVSVSTSGAVQQARLNTEAGANYFLSTAIVFGFAQPSIELKEVVKAQGQALVREAERAETTERVGSTAANSATPL